MIFLASLVSLEDEEQKKEATARSPSVLTKVRAMEDFPVPGEPTSQQMRSSAEVVVSFRAGDNRYKVILSSSSARVFGEQGIALPRLAPRAVWSLWKRSDAWNNGENGEPKGKKDDGPSWRNS
jgi:hypothetical protein